jgi:hypothetical protein
MSRDEEAFEDALRRGMARLADEAPPGPTAGQIVGRLRRQKFRRRIAAGGAACGAAMAAAILIAVMAHRPSTLPPPGQDGDRALIAIAPTMTDEEIRESIMREARATRLIASTRILAAAPGSREDVRDMCRLIASQYGDTMAARATENLDLLKQGDAP